MASSEHLIEEILESTHFRILLKEKIQETIHSINQDRKLSCAAIPSIVTEIGDQLENIIKHRVKNEFNQQYTSYLQDNLNLRHDVQDLKLKVQKLNCQITITPSVSNQNLETQQGFLSPRHKDKQTSSTGNLQVAKLRQQIQTIKHSLQKVSHSNILQFVSDTNVQMCKKMDQKYQKLEHEIHQMSLRNFDTSLDKTTSEVLDLKYETLEQKLQGINNYQREMIDKFRNLETGIMDKYQTNLASIWNVITNMESNLRSSAQKKEKQKQKEPQQLSTLRSFISPSSRNSKKISFPNILNNLGWK